jgi:cupredoxin-like protein
MDGCSATDREVGRAGRAQPAQRTRGRFRPERMLLALLSATLLTLGASAARADDPPVFDLKLASGKFDPPEVVVPADAPFRLRVTNSDPAAIEFESFELHRERVVQPGETITVYLPALQPGTYPIFDDFHKDTPEAAIVCK